ncbi:hypothetical protein MLC59_09625 [Marinobacter bryozoorum]|uniref:hypothetical protein n=1 Tax=Marinobacter bryozoorum TaxID=256324 RepID=UPI0020058621|nr:hypothetical protein [Marinobacter bryozoorum]MCK7544426.1 hypothetical protein [Marinobacter bryozoorum]
MYNRIDLPLRPCGLTGLLAAGPWVFLAVASLWITVNGYGFLAPLPLALLVMARHRWRQNGSLATPNTVVRLTTRGQRLFAELASGYQEEVRASADSRIAGRYAVLGLRGLSSGHRYPVILLPAPRGNAPANALRQLRVWLRLMPPPATPTVNKNPLKRTWSGDNTHDH